MFVFSIVEVLPWNKLTLIQIVKNTKSNTKQKIKYKAQLLEAMTEAEIELLQLLLKSGTPPAAIHRSFTILTGTPRNSCHVDQMNRSKHLSIGRSSAFPSSLLGKVKLDPVPVLMFLRWWEGSYVRFLKRRGQRTNLTYEQIIRIDLFDGILPSCSPTLLAPALWWMVGRVRNQH